MKKCFVSILLIGALLCSMTGCGQNASTDTGTVQQDALQSGREKGQIHIRLGIGANAESSLGKGAQYMCDKVEEYSNGEITMELFADSLLGGDRDMIEGVSLGTIEMCNVATGTVGNFSDAFFVLDMPYVVTDRQTAYDALDGDTGRNILNTLNNTGIYGLSFWELGYRQLFTTNKIVSSPSDLKGLKIRVMENDLHIALWNGMGAYATPMSVSEVFTALQQGTIDAMENPIGPILTGKYYEAAPNCILTNHIYSATVNMINKDLYDSLTDEQREILKRADAEARAYERQLVQEEDLSAIEEWKAAGGTVTEVNIDEWQDAAGFIFDDFSDKIDMNVVNALRGE